MDEPIESTVTLPTRPVMAAVARAHVGSLLDDTPRIDDAVVIAAELATNAIRYSTATEFTITVELHADHRARIAVTDNGRRRQTPRGDVDPYVTGLGLVALIADDFGHDRTDDSSTTWAEIAWTAP